MSDTTNNGNPYDDVSINEALDQISDRCTDRTIRQAAYAIATRNGSYDESALKYGNPYVNIPVDEALSQLYDRCTDRTIRQAAFAIAANSRGDTLTNPYGKTALFSTNSSFSSIRTEKGRFSVRIRVGQYTTRSQTSTKHASSTSTNHSLLTLAVSSFPDVTHQELKVRGRPILLLM